MARARDQIIPDTNPGIREFPRQLAPFKQRLRVDDNHRERDAVGVRLDDSLLNDRRRGVSEDYVAGLDFGGGQVADQFVCGGDAFAQEYVDFFEEVALGKGFGLGGVDFDNDLGRGQLGSGSRDFMIVKLTVFQMPDGVSHANAERSTTLQELDLRAEVVVGEMSC